MLLRKLLTSSTVISLIIIFLLIDSISTSNIQYKYMQIYFFSVFTARIP